MYYMVVDKIGIIGNDYIVFEWIYNLKYCFN